MNHHADFPRTKKQKSMTFFANLGEKDCKEATTHQFHEHEYDTNGMCRIFKHWKTHVKRQNRLGGWKDLFWHCWYINRYNLPFNRHAKLHNSYRRYLGQRFANLSGDWLHLIRHFVRGEATGHDNLRKSRVVAVVCCKAIAGHSAADAASTSGIMTKKQKHLCILIGTVLPKTETRPCSLVHTANSEEAGCSETDLCYLEKGHVLIYDLWKLPWVSWKVSEMQKQCLQYGRLLWSHWNSWNFTESV